MKKLQEATGHMKHALQHLTEVYESAGSVRTAKGRFTTVNELTDQVPAVRPRTLRAALSVLAGLDHVPDEATKVLSEEDKGAILAGLFSVSVGLPLAMARHNVTYDIPGSLQVALEMEYMDGRLTVNGLAPRDRLVIIDDTLASGGTLVALIQAARAAGCEIVDVRVIIEKLGYGGREALADIDIDVKAGLGIRVDDEGRIAVVEHLQCQL